MRIFELYERLLELDTQPSKQTQLTLNTLRKLSEAFRQVVVSGDVSQDDIEAESKRLQISPRELGELARVIQQLHSQFSAASTRKHDPVENDDGTLRLRYR